MPKVKHTKGIEMAIAKISAVSRKERRLRQESESRERKLLRQIAEEYGTTPEYLNKVINGST